MNDLISRQDAIDELEKLAFEMKQWSELFQIQAKGVLTARNIIESLPSAQTTADVVEVVHGEWIMINEQLAKCSVCGGYESTNGKDKTGKGVIFKTQKNFCPKCGARMDGAK